MQQLFLFKRPFYGHFITLLSRVRHSKILPVKKFMTESLKRTTSMLSFLCLFIRRPTALFLPFYFASPKFTEGIFCSALRHLTYYKYRENGAKI